MPKKLKTQMVNFKEDEQHAQIKKRKTPKKRGSNKKLRKVTL